MTATPPPPSGRRPRRQGKRPNNISPDPQQPFLPFPSISPSLQVKIHYPPDTQPLSSRSSNSNHQPIMSGQSEAFQTAVVDSKKLTAKPSNDELLELYGTSSHVSFPHSPSLLIPTYVNALFSFALLAALYKVAIGEDFSKATQPGMFDLKARLSPSPRHLPLRRRRRTNLSNMFYFHIRAGQGQVQRLEEGGRRGHHSRQCPGALCRSRREAQGFAGLRCLQGARGRWRLSGDTPDGIGPRASKSSQRLELEEEQSEYAPYVFPQDLGNLQREGRKVGSGGQDTHKYTIALWVSHEPS